MFHFFYRFFALFSSSIIFNYKKSKHRATRSVSYRIDFIRKFPCIGKKTQKLPDVYELFGGSPL